MGGKVNAVFGLFLIQGTFATLLNVREIKNGTCHLETLKVDILLDCDVREYQIQIVFNNTLVQCSVTSGEPQCHVDSSANSVYNTSSNIMTFSTQFNHTKHAGKKMWIKSSCTNGTEYVPLLPCVSGFKAHAHHNTTHVMIACEHSSFNDSNTGIRIHGNETLSKCSWNKSSQENICTFGATALADGVQYTTPYKQGMKLACSLDGQTIPISPQAENNKGNEESLSLPNFTNDAVNGKVEETQSSASENEMKVQTTCILAVLLYIA
ncbi:uncharacterized protein LOC125661838 isoform X1 [Ostrea edulis]|uniref:uncharacterized protein LOC125661838 isoform X1 n=1 Tax=Ostrea edulis TaxID=37623 RepID=UPI0024AFB68F|nr:uncharacterized protein LOC125661838 isoform X1 [Ostrea edulis]